MAVDENSLVMMFAGECERMDDVMDVRAGEFLVVVIDILQPENQVVGMGRAVEPQLPARARVLDRDDRIVSPSASAGSGK
jgi:hypothetical protein